MTAPTLPHPDLFPDVSGGGDQECIFCPCKWFMSFCGKYDPSDHGPVIGIENLDDPRICKDCRGVTQGKGNHCPYCGREPGWADV